MRQWVNFKVMHPDNPTFIEQFILHIEHSFCQSCTVVAI